MSRPQFEQLQRTRSEDEREASAKHPEASATIPAHHLDNITSSHQEDHFYRQQHPQSSSEDEFSGDESSGEFHHPKHLQSTSKKPSAAVPLQAPPELTDTSMYSEEEASNISEEAASLDANSSRAFLYFRLNYLLVTLVIMLADGLQGTHLYVLYEGYGFSVASLYCLGFLTGAVTAPITGPLVDKFGRKRSALLYCALEMFINMLEQYPFLVGLVASRMIGGITTNLLSSVFETWLDTEYRKRGFDQEKYEVLMRDSLVVKNLAAIASGYLAHILAEQFGPVGPFEGAVSCTGIALVVVALVWSENYGSEDEAAEEKKVSEYLSDAIQVFKTDSRILRVGIIQGLSLGSLQIFVFLWSPALKELSKYAYSHTMALDKDGEPAYGLIFGAFMAAGVIGGVGSSYVRKCVTQLLTPLQSKNAKPEVITIDGEGEVRPMAVEFLAALCYLFSAFMFLVPCLVSETGVMSFMYCLAAFIVYEVLIGLYSPCEGVIRSLYIPADSRCSMMTLPSIVVNVAVSIGVASTNFITLKTAFILIAGLMFISAGLQISLISKREWDSLFGRVDRLRRGAFGRSRSFSALEVPKPTKARFDKRSMSMPIDVNMSQDEDDEDEAEFEDQSPTVERRPSFLSWLRQTQQAETKKKAE